MAHGLSRCERRAGRMSSGGRIPVLGPSTDSDEPITFPRSNQHAKFATSVRSCSTQGAMGRFAYAGGRPLYRVYAPRREYAFMEENGPVDHGRLRCTRCERWCVLPHPSAREGNTLVSSSLHSLQWPSSSSIQKVPATRKPLILLNVSASGHAHASHLFTMPAAWHRVRHSQ